MTWDPEKKGIRAHQLRMNMNNWYISSDWGFRERWKELAMNSPQAFMEGDAEGRFDLEVKGSTGQRGEVEKAII